MKRLLKITFLTGLLTLFRMMTGFLIAKVVAIYTGPTGMAMLGQIQNVVSSLSGIMSAPVGSGIVRYTAENYREGFEACSPWWKAASEWILLFAVILIPSGIIFARHLSYWLFESTEYYWLIYITVLVLPFSAIGTLITSVINGQQQYRRYVVMGALATVASSSVMVFLILIEGLSGALLAAAIQMGLIGFVLTVFSFNQPWFRFSLWLGKSGNVQRKAIGSYVLMALTSSITFPVALLLIRNFLVARVGWEHAGYWQAVWKISEVYLGVITMALSTYFLPRLSQLNGYSSIRQEIQSTLKIVLPVVMLLAVSIYLLRDLVITLLFTESFSPARDLFAIQLLGDTVKVVAWLYAFPMLAKGATKWFVLTELGGALSFVGLSYCFIQEFGLQGVTISYLLNYLFYFLFVFFNLRNVVRD
ncbi:O-antigen translocase [Endozoicomonas sp.]|uniref:O-antigen translocase n=1 Tax=Endozoicomonas sp. TaxID=1892382 RepID=UPI003AF6F246